MDFNKIEAEERHIFKLWTLCRVCGQAGEKLQYCLDNYADILGELYTIDISKDDPAVHPQMVCQKCRLVLQHYLKKVAKSKIGKARLPSLPALYTFNKHSEECDVCDRASGLLPKRKRSADSVENTSPAKVARQDDVPLEGEGSTEDNSVQNTENTEELGSPQESDRANILLQALQGTIGEEAIMENPKETIDRPDEQEGFTKYVYLNMIRRFKARGIKEDKSRDSVDVSRFRQKNFASTFLTCLLCKRLPLKPVMTECKHVFCENCISDWLNFGNVCPKCEEVIVELSDATEQLKHLYMLLDAPCSFASKGCEIKLTPFEINRHERECPYNGKAGNPSDSSDEDEPEHQDEVDIVEKVEKRKRKSLRFVTPRLATTRTEELKHFLNNMCKEEREDKVDVLFYMLKGALAENGDARTMDVDLMWRNKRKPILLRRKARRVTSLPPQRQQLNRRKGTPRKRGRPRKIPLPEVVVSSDQEEEVDEAEEDLEEMDATWKPPSGVGRSHGQDEEEEEEEEVQGKDEDNKDDIKKGNFAVEAVVEMADQKNVDTNNIVIVVEGNEHSIEGASVTVL